MRQCRTSWTTISCRMDGEPGHRQMIAHHSSVDMAWLQHSALHGLAFTHTLQQLEQVDNSYHSSCDGHTKHSSLHAFIQLIALYHLSCLHSYSYASFTTTRLSSLQNTSSQLTKCGQNIGRVGVGPDHDLDVDSQPQVPPAVDLQLMVPSAVLDRFGSDTPRRCSGCCT